MALWGGPCGECNVTSENWNKHPIQKWKECIRQSVVVVAKTILFQQGGWLLASVLQRANAAGWGE